MVVPLISSIGYIEKKFNNNPFCKYELLKEIYKSGFETIIDTTFSREILYGDLIVKTSKAKNIMFVAFVALIAKYITQ